MMALSVRQAWADLLFPPLHLPGAPAPKRIETRRWGPALQKAAKELVGRRIAIHASGTFCPMGGLTWLEIYAEEEISEARNPERLPRRCILGTVQLVQARMLSKADESAALCSIEPGTFGLVVAEPRRFPSPVRYPGQLGFFRLAPDALTILVDVRGGPADAARLLFDEETVERHAGRVAQANNLYPSYDYLMAGETRFVATGDTYPHRERFMSWAWHWDPKRRAWVNENRCQPDDPEIRTIRKLPGVTVVEERGS